MSPFVCFATSCHIEDVEQSPFLAISPSPRKDCDVVLILDITTVFYCEALNYKQVLRLLATIKSLDPTSISKFHLSSFQQRFSYTQKSQASLVKTHTHTYKVRITRSSFMWRR